MKIVKICKKHGELSDEDIQLEKNTWKKKDGTSVTKEYMRCTQCRREKDIKYKHSHREQHLASVKEWRANNRDHVNAREREGRKKNPEKYRQWAKNNREKEGLLRTSKEIARLRGITIEQYQQMFIDQNGLCKICQKPETRMARNGGVARLCLDHCHKTNIVRALLCHSCNQVVGHSKESIEILESAINYLIEFDTSYAMDSTDERTLPKFHECSIADGRLQ